MKTGFTSVLCIGLVLFFGCKSTQSTDSESVIFVQKENRPYKKWKVVWEDDFSSPLLDNSK